MRANHYDAIVIGVGSMGSAACWVLAKRGLRVLGLEQFDIPHANGSYGGESRIIRKAYFEHANYVPLLERSYTRWKELESASNTEIYKQTGIIYFGKDNSSTLSGLRESASRYKVAIETLDTEHLHGRFSAFQLPGNFKAVFEPEAGFLLPEKAVATFCTAAEKYGGEVRTHCKVTSWSETASEVEVETNIGKFTCDRLIVSSGAWTGKLLPNLKMPLKVTRQVLAWIRPTNALILNNENFPCWFIEDERGIFYGFPLIDGRVKLALHKAGETTDPDNVKRIVDDTDVTPLRQTLQRYLPELGTDVVETRVCLYTYSDDEHFIVDHLPGSKKIVVACGFSGHGFKFAPVIGEALADLAMAGVTRLPIDFLRIR